MTLRKMIAAWAGVIALCAAPTGADAAADQGGGAINVTVIDDTGAAIARARVLLAGTTVAFHRVVEADDQGRAAFTGVPPGTFRLSAEKVGFVTRAFGERDGTPAVLVSIDEGDSFAARVQLPRVGAVSGVTFDERGQPTRARVHAYRYVVVAGRRDVQVVTSVDADQQGTYRFDDLAPGEYVVGAVQTADASKSEADSGAWGSLPIFYPSADALANAAPVLIRAGDTTPDINLYLRRVRPAALEGMVGLSPTR